MSFAVIGLPLSWGTAWFIKREPVNAPRCFPADGARLGFRKPVIAAPACRLWLAAGAFGVKFPVGI
jgi:hypothetical protein